MLRPKDAAKRSSSSAYEQAITGHKTKQNLLEKSTFPYFYCIMSRERLNDTGLRWEVSVVPSRDTLKNHLCFTSWMCGARGYYRERPCLIWIGFSEIKRCTVSRALTSRKY